ncbi:hypothetical protein [Latilactobacillus sakei]|nr:hypothetical protein [Latilactobacillus sakei]SPS04287.1 hypothetical protein LAS9624_01127 [Latilactobacillus sakei]
MNKLKREAPRLPSKNRDYKEPRSLEKWQTITNFISMLSLIIAVIVYFLK